MVLTNTVHNSDVVGESLLDNYKSKSDDCGSMRMRMRGQWSEIDTVQCEVATIQQLLVRCLVTHEFT